jgi:hypothetical protein
MIGIEDDAESFDGGFGGNDVDGILSPDRVADDIVAGIRAGRFLVLPHPQVRTYFQRKAADYDRWIAGMQRFRRKLMGLERWRSSTAHHAASEKQSRTVSQIVAQRSFAPVARSRACRRSPMRSWPQAVKRSRIPAMPVTSSRSNH